MVHRVPRVGGNVKSYMLAYDFNTTAYTRDPMDHFSLLKDMLYIYVHMHVHICTYAGIYAVYAGIYI